MSSIFFKTKQSAEVHRLEAGANGTRTYTKNSDIEIAIHNLTAEDSVIYDGVSDRGFRGFVLYSVDVQKRDEIHVGSEKYNVKAVQAFNYGSFPHKKLILEQVRET